MPLSLGLKLETVCLSEMLAPNYEFTWCYTCNLNLEHINFPNIFFWL
jgi:hypothetical protein